MTYRSTTCTNSMKHQRGHWACWMPISGKSGTAGVSREEYTKILLHVSQLGHIRSKSYTSYRSSTQLQILHLPLDSTRYKILCRICACCHHIKPVCLPTTSVHPVSMLILHPREIQVHILGPQTVRQRKNKQSHFIKVKQVER